MSGLQLHVHEGQIIVNMMGSRLTITFELSEDGQLSENPFWTRDEGNAEFRTKALQAAYVEARQRGWLDVLKQVA
jgi:hypothetical protein